jgi:hypothetical protein
MGLASSKSTKGYRRQLLICVGNDLDVYPICAMVLEYLPTFALENHGNLASKTTSGCGQSNQTWTKTRDIKKQCGT